MRENRLYGSEGGVAVQEAAIPTPYRSFKAFPGTGVHQNIVHEISGVSNPPRNA